MNNIKKNKFWLLSLAILALIFSGCNSSPEEEITIEMYIMQLAHLKGMNTSLVESSKEEITNHNDLKKEIIKEEKDFKENNTLKIKSQLKNTDQVKN